MNDAPEPDDPIVPDFAPLPRRACENLLRRNRVGRLAYSDGIQVDIEPLHYAVDDADGLVICLRTVEGSKVAALSHYRWVAFEVDEVDAEFAWRSVVVRGSIYRVTVADSEVYPRTLESLRRVFPRTLREGDPVAFRRILLRLHVDALTGRVASPRGELP